MTDNALPGNAPHPRHRSTPIPVVLAILLTALTTPFPPVLPSEDHQIELRYRVFPPETTVHTASDGTQLAATPLTDSPTDDAWRVITGLSPGTILELRAPGYELRRIHLPRTANGGARATTGGAPSANGGARATTSGAPSANGGARATTGGAPSATGGAPPTRFIIEERLYPDVGGATPGPLRFVSETPTGSSPKSATFLTPTTVAVPLLRDAGIDLFHLEEDRWGTTSLVPAGRLAPPPPWAELEGFVEPLVIAETGELWVSQMTTDQVHRFDITTGRWLSVHPAGGGWPKVMAFSRRTGTVWVSNWYGESVVELDGHTGDIIRTIPVGGQPRGLLLTNGDSVLWVCIFSTGEILRLDTRTGAPIDRFGPEIGAARHIIGSPRSHRVYYSDMYYGTVSLVAGPGGADRPAIRSPRLGSNINTIAIDPAERYLYVSERGRNNRESYLLRGPHFGRILVLDPLTLETVQELYGRNQPTGLAVSPDGRFVVATDFLDDNITLYEVTPRRQAE